MSAKTTTKTGRLQMKAKSKTASTKKMKPTTEIRTKPRDSFSGLSAQEQLKVLKNFLLEQKSNILNKSRELDSSSLSTDQGGVQDEADVASHQLSLNLTLNLHDRDRQSLAQIEKALGKLQSGRYGRCERCSAEIGLRRLHARPFASLCIDCMQDEEEFSQHSNSL